MTRPLRTLIALPLAAAALAFGAAPAFAGSADQEIADQGIIVDSDMPATWTSSPSDESDLERNLKLAARIPACKSYVKFARASEATTKAASDEYSSGQHQVSNKSYVFARAAVAKKTIAALGGSKVPGCLEEVFDKAINTQLRSNRAFESAEVEIAPVDAGQIGDDTVAYEGTLTLNLTDGSSQEVNIGLLSVRVGRVITTYSITAPLDSTEIERVATNAVTATLTRTAAAL